MNDNGSRTIGRIFHEKKKERSLHKKEIVLNMQKYQQKEWIDKQASDRMVYKTGVSSNSKDVQRMYWYKQKDKPAVTKYVELNKDEVDKQNKLIHGREFKSFHRACECATKSS